MNILAVDGTGEKLTLALQAGEKTHKLRRAGRSQDELLLDAIDDLLKRAKLKTKDLDAIACASGPGRFTGIRIGMAYAGMAAWELKIPALAISRLEALAWKAPAGRTCVSLPGWREERYYQLFRKTKADAIPKPEAAPVWISAEGWQKVKESLSGVLVIEQDVDASALLLPAAAQLARARKPAFAPLYLKPAGYELRRK